MALKEKAVAFEAKRAEIKKFWDDVDGIELSDFTVEQKQTIDRLTKEGETLAAQVEEESGYKQAKERMDALSANLSQPQGRPEYPNTDPRQPVQGRKSVGQEFIESPQFKQFLERVAPTGGLPAEGMELKSAPFESKALVLSSATSGGALVRRDYGPWPVDLPLRPLTIRDVITVLQTTSNLIEYVRVNALTRGAAIVPEATATTSTGYSNAAKPEAGMALAIIQEAVKTLAVWMPVTRQILSDVPQLQSLINAFLGTDLDLALEEEIISGAGGSSHFTGLDNQAGLTPQAFDSDMLITTRRARTKVRTIGRANPTGYLLNPYDWEDLDLTRNDTAGNFYFGGPMMMGQKMLWGLPVIESEVVPQGTGYVGDLKQIVVWDRERNTIRVTDSHSDFFTHNLIAVLAEIRAAMGVLRPAAIVKMDLHAGANS